MCVKLKNLKGVISQAWISNVLKIAQSSGKQ